MGYQIACATSLSRTSLMSRRFRRATLLASLLSVGWLGACRLPGETAIPTDHLALTGTVEAREIEVAFQVPGRIQHLAVDEGDRVVAGQVLATLDSADYQLALNNAQAQAEAARATLAALQAGSRPQERRVAEANLSHAEADARFARAEVRRLEELVAKRMASDQQLDQARWRHDSAMAEMERARQQLELAREGPRREEIERAAADYQARQVAVDIAQRQLAYATLVSPLEGVVTLRLAEAGEFVATGRGVLRIAELAHPWVRAYVSETELARLKLGQSAEVRADGLPDHVFPGRLAFIAAVAEFTPKTVETRELRVDLVYRVKIDVANPDGQLKLGMPVDVVLKTGP